MFWPAIIEFTAILWLWLDEGIKVLKGVSIRENASIGIGSIVTRDIPANAIAGIPCKVIGLKEIED